MSLNTALKLLLEEYPNAVGEEFKGHAVADFVRNEIPKYVKIITEHNPRYLVTASPGKGNWAAVPWVAILDRFVSETVQDGYYVVYLVKEDFSGIYLSLNQGVTTVQKRYGASATDALQVRAEDFGARFGKVDQKYIRGKIDLACSSGSKLGRLYEVGSIISIFYPANAIPGDRDLSEDLKNILALYFKLTTLAGQFYSGNDIEDDEETLNYENLQKVRTHKRIERNRKLSEKVKKLKGSTCEACGFNFEDKYGVLGRGFIEAHHLTPLHKLKGEKVALDPMKDFSVLCSNCHRMVHKSEFVSEIREFRAKYIVNSG